MGEHPWDRTHLACTRSPDTGCTRDACAPRRTLPMDQPRIFIGDTKTTKNRKDHSVAAGCPVFIRESPWRSVGHFLLAPGGALGYCPGEGCLKGYFQLLEFQKYRPYNGRVFLAC